MKKDKNMTDPTMSLSKSRKIARKQEIARAKRNAKLTKIIGGCVLAAIIIGGGSFAGYKIYREANKVVASSNYSKYLTTNGTIKDIDAASYVTLADYKNFTAPLSEIEYSDESVEKDIQTVLDANKTLDVKTSSKIADGDTVNIDYVGKVDGVAFDGGDTEGEGTDLTIGSDQYVDGFEDQLIGHQVGDTVNVEVTFPDNYSNTDLAGKDAVFEVVINGLYVTPEFTDAFVAKNLSDYADTVDGYEQYLKETNYNTNLEQWIEKNLIENSTVSSYPEDYTNQLKATIKYDDEQAYKSINSYLAQYGSQYTYSSVYDYKDMSEYEYEDSLVDTAKTQAEKDLIYQAILEKEGVTVTAEDYLAYLLENGKTQEDYDNAVKTYGEGYVAKIMVRIKGLELVKSLVAVK